MELLALVESVDHVSVRYRLGALAPALAERGVRLTLEALPESLLGRLRLYRRAADFGGAVLQRTLLPGPELAALRRRSKCLVFDYDDAVWMRDSYHPRGPLSRKRARRFARTVGAADVILAGNDFLARNARPSRAAVAVAPTVVDPGVCPAAVHARRGGECALTWVGTSSTLRGLALAGEHFRAAAERLPGLTLRVVCDRPAELPIRTEWVRWDAATEARDLAACDIGVSWVPDDDWSRGKCGLKLVQYLAAGLPAVANPVGVHGEIVPPGWGTLATSPTEWAGAVERLANDPALRQRLGDLGRARVRDSYSVESAADAWASTLAKVGGAGVRNLLALNLGVTLKAGGYRWVLAGHGALGGIPPDPAAWAREGRVTVLKENLQRTIARVELPGGAVYLKRVRANTPRSLLREWVRPAKARLEFENLLELRRRGVATVEPLAWGAASLWPGESVLLTRAAEGAVTLGEVLAAPRSPGARRELAARFGAYLAALHAAGVRHPDPHPGNVLVGAGGEFILADLHAVILHRGPLPPAEAALDLTLWNRYFQARASRSDRARFFRHYCTGGTVSKSERRQSARDLEAATEASNLRFWHARLKRPWLANRDTAPVPGGYAVRGFDPAALARWAPDPAAVLGELAERWKDSKSAAVGPLTLGVSGARVECVAKLFRAKAGWRRLKRVGRLTPAERSWAYGHNLLGRGLPTPRPLCLVQPGRLGAALVVFERVPAALDLPAALDAALRLPPAARREVLAAWADRLADLARAMHQRGARQRDLKASNIVMAGAASELASATPVLIDLVGVEAFDRPAPDPARLADLARLAASVAARGDIRRGVVLRFLRRYLGAEARDWKRRWREISAAAAAKAARNRASGRALT